MEGPAVRLRLDANTALAHDARAPTLHIWINDTMFLTLPELPPASYSAIPNITHICPALILTWVPETASCL